MECDELNGLVADLHSGADLFDKIGDQLVTEGVPSGRILQAIAILVRYNADLFVSDIRLDIPEKHFDRLVMAYNWVARANHDIGIYHLAKPARYTRAKKIGDVLNMIWLLMPGGDQIRDRCLR